ncbi:MAG: cytidylyltransferase domain-containing protein [bacterium]
MKWALVQARMTSKRLPNKVLKKAGGMPLLELLVRRLRRSRLLDDVAVITSAYISDNDIEELCHKIDCQIYRGELDDVLARAYNASVHFGVQTIVRITADCPLMDADIVDMVLENHRSDISLTRNIIDDDGGFPRGFDVEVLSFDVLSDIYNRAKRRFDREHFTHYIYDHPDEYNIKLLSAPSDTQWDPHWRLCVDEWEDYLLIKAIVEHFGDRFIEAKISDITDFLWKNTRLAYMNSHIKQKT